MTRLQTDPIWLEIKIGFFSESLEKLNLEYFWPRATKQATLNEKK